MKSDTSQEKLPNDISTIKNFFSFISGSDDEIHTVAFLLDNPKGVAERYGTFHGKVNEIIETLEMLQGQYGYNVSLHTTLNRTNLLGRKKTHIESCRVLAVDLDGVPQEKL